MEVMGLMLGEFVDEYTVRVVDVFAMPQSGTGVSVEAVDHAFQTNMLDMLKQTGRSPSLSLFYLPLSSIRTGAYKRTNKCIAS
jgi:26S proteasome regulatory subunit N11